MTMHALIEQLRSDGPAATPAADAHDALAGEPLVGQARGAA